MDKVDQINFYAVKQDLSVEKADTIENCFKVDSLLYVIVETRGTWDNPTQGTIFSNPDLTIQLLDKDKSLFKPTEDGWMIVSVRIGSSKRWGVSRTLPCVDIADPLGNIQTVYADVEYYRGIIQLHRLLKYVSKCSNWDIANERKDKMNLKKIFVRLKNEKEISITYPINADEDYWIRLSFRNGMFKIRSCIIEGDPYIDGLYKEDNEFETDDFYDFIHKVHEKFPAVVIPHSFTLNLV